MSNIIAVKHNIEVAHRLYELPGKCEQIHGHSMWVTLFLKGELNSHGILEGIEFGDLKRVFRQYLDEQYDHHLLLNAADPFAGPIWQVQHKTPSETGEVQLLGDNQTFLPGLVTWLGDPTTENIAEWIGTYMLSHFSQVHAVEVWETSVNMARWEADTE